MFEQNIRIDEQFTIQYNALNNLETWTVRFHNKPVFHYGCGEFQLHKENCSSINLSKLYEIIYKIRTEDISSIR